MEKTPVQPGQVYGRWTVIGEPNTERHPKVKCRCACGKLKMVRTYSLVNGRSKSCGCVAKENHSEVMGAWFKGSAQRREAYVG